ncbi:MAG: ribose 5-phosphate isomerase B [Stellaceae bacterium]
MAERVAVAVDHGGFGLKPVLLGMLDELGLTVLDLGAAGAEAVDYPDFAHALARAIETGEAGRGILACGTGIGMAIAANRHSMIRAALCHDGLTARFARRHNDANVLVLGGRLIGPEAARDCITEFFSTPFEGGRHARRLAKVAMEGF